MQHSLALHIPRQMTQSQARMMAYHFRKYVAMNWTESSIADFTRTGEITDRLVEDISLIMLEPDLSRMDLDDISDVYAFVISRRSVWSRLKYEMMSVLA